MNHLQSKFIICDSTYTWGGVTYDSNPGIYSNTQVFSNSIGCDSVVTLNLTIGVSDSSDFSVFICDSTFTWDGVIYDSTGIYTNLYTNEFGCDSTVTLDLTINNSSSSSVTVTACDSFAWDGITYSLTGMYTNIYTAT